jgi:putative DNA primase/helicase
MVLASEVPPNVVFRSELVKKWTGGDRIEAMAKYEKPFVFTPQGTLFFAGNVRPEIPYHEKGTWERVQLIPFEQVIPKGEQDRRLLDKLREPEQCAAILAFAVEGLRDLMKRDWELDPPRAVEEATQEYRTENDPLGGFMRDHCILRDGAWTRLERLYVRYQRWALAEGAEAMEKVQLSKELSARGFTDKRRRVRGKQHRGRLGIALKKR